MTEEKRCWICRRTEAEVNKELDDLLAELGVSEDRVMHELELGVTGNLKVWICEGCHHVFFNMTRHDTNKKTFLPDDYDIVLFQDLRELELRISIFND